jgi:TRAP-type C4-dicarboxylate transport system substrate-binding protein
MNVGFKIYEVAKYFAFVDFGAVVGNIITINLDRWKKMPKEVQDIMVEVGKEHTVVETKMTKEKEAAGLEVLKKYNVNMPILTFEEKRRWANMMPEIPDQMAKDGDKRGMPGSLVMKTYLDELEKDGFKFPRRWVIK